MAIKTKSTIEARLKLLATQVGGPSALAALLGIHRGTLYDYLAGVREVPATRLEKIAAMYPCDLDWLTTGRGEPPPPSTARTLEAKAASRGDIFGLGPRPGLHMPKAMARTGRQIKLEIARDRVMELIKMYEAEEIKKVLGTSLFEEVKAGRACPSAELLFALAPALGVKQAWLLGFEE